MCLFSGSGAEPQQKSPECVYLEGVGGPLIPESIQGGELGRSVNFQITTPPTFGDTGIPKNPKIDLLRKKYHSPTSANGAPRQKHWFYRCF